MNLFHSPFGNLFRFLSRLDRFFSRRKSRRVFLPLFLTAILFPLVSYEGMGALGEEADGDRSVSWRIVLPDNPQPVEETAAKELQTHLTEMTGDDYPILSESKLGDPAGPAIFVGATRKGTEILQTTHPSPLKFDEIFLQAIPNATSPALILTGHERRGALYAVYSYLEDICGCRWYTPDATVVPKRETIPFPEDLKIDYAPQIISREVYNDLAFPNPFSARNKGNGHIPAEYGGRVEIMNFVHSFYHYINPDRYFKDHPEWFSEINGERTSKDAQLCLTNDEMRAELTKNVLEELRQHPEYKIVDISQNDHYRFCECEKCRALDEAEGSHSGTLIHFLNQVAADIEKEFPDVLVETLAYQYTRKPPKTVRPRHNILIRLCSIECAFAQPFTGPKNEEFKEDMEGWSAIASYLFVWDYVTNYDDYIGPHPNWRSLAPNIRFFADHHVIGVFEEGEGHDFCEMKNWALLKLMWDPSLEMDALMNDFCYGYYGDAAAPYLLEYWKVLGDRVEETVIDLGCFKAKSFLWLDLATLNEVTRLMNAALDATRQKFGEDSPYLKRITKSKLAIDSVWLKRYEELKLESVKTEIPFEGPADFTAAAEEFAARCKAEHFSGPDIGTVGKDGEDWFNSLPLGFVSPQTVALDADSWLANGPVSFQDQTLFLDGKDGRSTAIYQPNRWKGNETITVEFKLDGTPDESPEFGLVFNASDLEHFTFVRMSQEGVTVGQASPDEPAKITFDKMDYPSSVGEWHTLSVHLKPDFMTLFLDNRCLYQWLFYPSDVSREKDGAIGFFGEKGTVEVRNLFLTGKPE